MIRMGLDGSTKCSGWCIFDDDKLLCYGKITADKDLEWRERVVYMMKEVASLIQKHHVKELCIELPIKTTKKNVNTLEQLFSLHGAILGVASALHIKFTPVHVNTWRSKLGLLDDIPKDKDNRAVLKKRSVYLANKLYDLDLIWKSKTSKDNDDDISDAILIAHTVIHK